MFVSNMTRKQFVEHFWDTDFIGYNGFDVLCKRLKAGRKMCKELDEYFKERIKAEQIYAKSLFSAVKKIQSVDDIAMGNLGKAILQLQKETERMTMVHEESAKYFLALERELTTFSDEQQSKRLSVEDNMKKTNQSKQQAYKQTLSLRDKYVQRCRDKDNAEEAFANAKQSVTVKTKDLEKLEKNKDKSIENMEHADTQYKNSVEQLDRMRVHWENEMQKTCNTFEELDEQRIEMLRDVVWRSANVDSQTAVECDQCAENVRVKLEQCDIDTDIEEFINNNRTGSERPAQIVYENYYNKRGGNNEVSRQTNGERSTLSRRPVRPVEPPRQIPMEQTLIAFDDGDGIESPYASIGAKEVRRERQQYRVVRPYTAKGPSEHTVQANETVEVVREMPNNMIQINKNGRIGLIPKSCFQVLAYV